MRERFDTGEAWGERTDCWFHGIDDRWGLDAWESPLTKVVGNGLLKLEVQGLPFQVLWLLNTRGKAKWIGLEMTMFVMLLLKGEPI